MRLTLQQLPYDCPDPSFEFRDPSDILERIFGKHATDNIQTKLSTADSSKSPLTSQSSSRTMN